jgi:hypothetical protein
LRLRQLGFFFSRIVRISARKLYAEGIEPGATISVKTLN